MIDGIGLPKDSLASLMCKGNDFQNQNFTALLSGPYVSAGALSITPDNFEKSMVVHAARRIPKATWLNDRDQFMKPVGTLSDEFITDCTVWNLFSNSNQTASLKDVLYEGQTYQIHNHFFPYSVPDVKSWDIKDSDIALTLANAEDTFVASWLTKRTLSDEAKAVYLKAMEIYQLYFASLNQIRTSKFKIECWDAGWWQIKQALTDVNLCKDKFAEWKILHNRLKEKIYPGLLEYKIITE